MAAAAFLAGSVAPLPSEAVLGALVVLGRGAASMTFIATVANVMGAATLLTLGRSGRPFFERRVDPGVLARSERWFLRFGVWTLLLSWLPLVGDAFVLVAGAFRVSWWAALPLLTAGKAFRYAAVAAGALALRS